MGEMVAAFWVFLSVNETFEEKSFVISHFLYASMNLGMGGGSFRVRLYRELEKSLYPLVPSLSNQPECRYLEKALWEY